MLKLFSIAEGVTHPFGSLHRIKMTLSIIRNDCQINLDNLVHLNEIKAYYPIKDEACVLDIASKWITMEVLPWEQPIDSIRLYFGEKIAFYYHFLGHFGSALIPLAIVGVITFLSFVIMSSGSLSDIGNYIDMSYMLV